MSTLIQVLILLGLLLGLCAAAFAFKTKLGGKGGYKNQRPPGASADR